MNQHVRSSIPLTASVPRRLSSPSDAKGRKCFTKTIDCRRLIQTGIARNHPSYVCMNVTDTERQLLHWELSDVMVMVDRRHPDSSCANAKTRKQTRCAGLR